MVTLRDVFNSPYLTGLFALKPIPQTQPHCCGAACIATILTYYGMAAHERMVADAAGTNQAEGTPPKDMLRYLASRKMLATAWTKYPLDKVLGRLQTGATTMVHWDDHGDHWLIPCGLEPEMGMVVLADPARMYPPNLGRKSCFWMISVADFSDQYQASGRMVLVIDRPHDYITANNQLKRTVFRMWDYEDQQTRSRRYAEKA
jgi:ABC-type bacteriocin/lantibiotic exporter with double-glycine peptidase domain